MQVLILGKTGLLGSAVYEVFSQLEYDITASTRDTQGDIFIDLLDPVSVSTSLDIVSPDIIINCTGITKHVSDDAMQMIYVNSYMPHFLSQWASLNQSLYVHISTDCVFYGDRGNYSETDLPDCIDLYGRTKILGEVDSKHLIIRTSFIGRETYCRGLLGWFLSQSGRVIGYRQVLWNGLSALEIGRIIHQMIQKEVRGLWHVGGETINKYAMLCMMRNVFDKNIDITPQDTCKLDRTLDIEKFQGLNIISPPLEDLLQEIKNQ